MRYLILLPILLFSIACNTGSISKETSNDVQFLGEKINDKGAITVGKLMSNIEGKTEMKAKVTGTVTNVCQVKGCWMTMQQENAELDDMMIKFKDYGFFMPMDLSGKEVIIDGIAKVQETSVEELRHYAEDAGNSPEEIAKITNPKLEVVFEAHGVIIKN